MQKFDVSEEREGPCVVLEGLEWVTIVGVLGFGVRGCAGPRSEVIVGVVMVKIRLLALSDVMVVEFVSMLRDILGFVHVG